MPIAVGPPEWLIMQAAPWLILIVLIAIFVRVSYSPLKREACS